MNELLVRALRWRLPLVLAVFVPAAAVGVLAAEQRGPTFEAVAVIGVIPESAEYANADLVGLASSRFAVMLTSDATTAMVAEQTGMSIDDLRNGVRVEVGAGSPTLPISVVLSNEDDALAVANALADQAVEFGADDDQVDTSVLAGASLESQPLVTSTRALQAAVVLAALIAALGLAMLLERLRPRLRRAVDVQELTDLPFLGTVATTLEPTSRPGRRTGQLVRAAYLAAHPDTPDAVALVGAVPGTPLAPLAVLVAQAGADAGERVLLVRGEPGSTADQSDADFTTHQPTDSDDDPEFALPRRLGHTITAAGASWDRVILEVPTDTDAAAVLAVRVGAAVVVLPAGARTDQVLATVARLRQLGVDVRGTALITKKQQR